MAAEQEDWYAILAVEITADSAKIRSAHRKKALICHPDKDKSPEAAILFQKITKAYEILSDEQARKAYDNVLRIKEEKKIRDGQRSEKRKRMKEDLEERERAAKKHKYEEEEEEANKKLQVEMDRLRREAKQRSIDEILAQNKSKEDENENENAQTTQNFDTIKIQWNLQADTPIDEPFIRNVFKDYGQIENVLMSAKKRKKSAMIVFKSPASARAAAQHKHPYFTAKWLGNDTETTPTKPRNDEPIDLTTPSPSLIGHTDYESLTITRLKREAERQKIIKQMINEETLST